MLYIILNNGEKYYPFREDLELIGNVTNVVIEDYFRASSKIKTIDGDIDFRKRKAFSIGLAQNIAERLKYDISQPMIVKDMDKLYEAVNSLTKRIADILLITYGSKIVDPSFSYLLHTFFIKKLVTMFVDIRTDSDLLSELSEEDLELIDVESDIYFIGLQTNISAKLEE